MMSANTVKTALTVNGPQRHPLTEAPARPVPTRTAASRRGASGRGGEHRLRAFAARMIRAHGRRVADGDVEGLPELLTLAAEIDAATQVAVNGLRGHGFSWAEIAARLGTTRQAAQQRWGK